MEYGRHYSGWSCCFLPVTWSCCLMIGINHGRLLSVETVNVVRLWGEMVKFLSSVKSRMPRECSAYSWGITVTGAYYASLPHETRIWLLRLESNFSSPSFPQRHHSFEDHHWNFSSLSLPQLEQHQSFEDNHWYALLKAFFNNQAYWHIKPQQHHLQLFARQNGETVQRPQIVQDSIGISIRLFISPL